TVVTQVAVSDPGSTKAANQAMRITTQGGGAVGDVVTLTFGGTPRDWSGLFHFKLAIKQSQPTSAVQWKVRMIDNLGGSASALIPVSGTTTFVNASLTMAAFVNDP